MGADSLLSVLSTMVGGVLLAVVAVAVLVAGWELLRQRELLDQLRRDRAFYAATSPQPLAAPAREAGAPAQPPAGAPPPAARAVTTAAPARREGEWIETRPTVLSFAPAVDDDTLVRQREPDLRLD
ncbi:MAG: hypothetical protein KIT17_08305 [Rubrivivax sp.]|nr:hypothetical protein [Rubrivivax sp.]